MIIWEASITDWISAIAAAFGVPLIIWGIIKIFRKNEEHEQTIGMMAQQIDELTKHTGEFKYQSRLMRESNELYRQQIEIQNELLIHNKVSEERKLKLQQDERRSKIKPHFVFSSAPSSPDKFTINLLNKGQTAKNLSLTLVGEEYVKIRIQEHKSEYEQNHKLIITGNADLTKTFFNSNLVSFDAVIMYNDEDGNSYKQEISKIKGSYQIGIPELVQNEN